MSTPEAERIKEWLNRYRQQSDELCHLFDELEVLENQATAAGVSRLDGMPHGSGRTADRLGLIVARLDHLRDAIAEKQGAAKATCGEIESAISQIRGPRWAEKRAVLRFRYLNFMIWPDVSFHLFGEKPDFAEREESYLRRTTKVHGDALGELVEILPDVAKGDQNDAEQ